MPLASRRRRPDTNRVPLPGPVTLPRQPLRTCRPGAPRAAPEGSASRGGPLGGWDRRHAEMSESGAGMALELIIAVLTPVPLQSVAGCRTAGAAGRQRRQGHRDRVHGLGPGENWPRTCSATTRLARGHIIRSSCTCQCRRWPREQVIWLDPAARPAVSRAELATLAQQQPVAPA